MIVISALGDKEQEDHHKFKANLVYRADSQAARAT